jgi:hypothetical protein
MSAHLTHEELTDKLLGSSSLTVNAHLLSCPGCASELDQMKSSIAAFRDAAHAWSEGALAADRTVPVVRTLPKWSWGTALAAAILFAAGFTFYLREHPTAKQDSSAQVAASVTKIAASQSQIEKDNELLSQVNSELAEAVPAPMQPLRLLESTPSSIFTTK